VLDVSDSGVVRSARVAIISAEASTKIILTEFYVAELPRPLRVQLQLTTFGGGSSSHGAYARLTQLQARKLADALEGWLAGRDEPAA
jgi:hypothetical protein